MGDVWGDNGWGGEPRNSESPFPGAIKRAASVVRRLGDERFWLLRNVLLVGALAVLVL